MNEGTTEERLRDYLKRVTVELNRTGRQLREWRAAAGEPVAIVGMACRLPGDIDSPEGLWDLVAEGRDAVGPFPTDRGWDADVFHPDPGHRGTSYVRDAAMLRDVAGFDPGFFGINRREALTMDPQQRLMLEVSFEVFERAGIDIRAMAGDRVGVYTGIVASDYLTRFAELPDEAEGYVTTGAIPSVASGRVAYTFGFEGPAVSVDTACSSSLTALHLAVRALRGKECDMALAGGVSVASSPLPFVDFSRQRGLAPDGRIKSFAAAADGTNWSEGAGVVLVERLSDAVRLGHDVLAVIRGSAVNQDGASNGLSAPNDLAQQRVITAALADAQLSSTDVDLVEAHGTGTPLGDPLEAKALLSTYGQGREPANPLWLGSVKSNLGHSAAAAGVTAVIKTVMALRHGVMPKTLNVDEPSPNVDWSSGAVELLAERRDWPVRDRARRAGVSSFGVSGTNAHVIVEAAPDAQRDEPWPPHEERGLGSGPAADVVPLLVSGRSVEALHANAERLAEHIGGDGGQLANIGYSLATSRTAWEHRGVVLAAHHQDARSGLGHLAAATPDPRVIGGHSGIHGRTGLVFPGQGAQWSGMAVDLGKTFPVFAESLGDCAEALRQVVDWDLWTELHGELDRVDVVQPALWAVMVSLARLWESFGVEPSAVLGHSQGEVAAAVVSGALSLADGAIVVARRSAIIGRRLAGRGGMASIDLPVDAARELIAPYGERVSVATRNGPDTTVVAGDAEAVRQLLDRCEATETRSKAIPVDYASHSTQVEVIRDELLDALSGITPRVGRTPMYSTVTGSTIDGSQLDADYWYRNLREPIRFNEAVTAALADGHRFFVEASAHPVLTVGLEGIFAAADTPAVAVGSLRRNDGGAARFLTSLAEGYVRGLPGVRWEKAFARDRVKRVGLPTYAFQRQRYWLEDGAPDRDPAGPEDSHAEFWDAVAREDRDAVAAELGIRAGTGLDEVLPALSTWHANRQRRVKLDALRYRVVWRRIPAGGRRPDLSGRWLVLTTAATARDPWADIAVTALTRHGADVESRTVDIRDGDALLRDGDAGLRGVVSLLALDDETLPARPAMSGGLAATLALVRSAAALDSNPRLWTVTRGAAVTGDGDPRPNPQQAMAWGLGLSAALEHPESWAGLVDLPGTADDASGDRLASILAEPQPVEDQLALRADGLYARRLVRSPLPHPDADRSWTPTGTVLITGGTGGVGADVALRLAEAGAEHLLLASRRGEAAADAERIRAEALRFGTRVSFAACDVTDRDSVRAMLLSIPADRPLRAVVHAAGELQAFQPITETDADTFATIAAAKVMGARHLDELLGDTPLDAFVLFSSNAGLWGSSGQSAYAAANAYLDSLAQRRRARGLTATSVSWGTWSLGMTGDRQTQAMLHKGGLPAFDPRLAMESMMESVAHGETSVAVTAVEWDRLFASVTMTRPSRLFDEIPETRRPRNEDATPHGERLVGELSGLDDAAKRERLLEAVRSFTAAALGMTTADIGSDQSFRELGIDSLTGLELRNKLGSAVELRLPKTLTFDHPTPAALADYLTGQVGSTTADSAPTEPAAPGTRTDSLTSLFLEACERGHAVRAHQFSEGLAAFRDTFTDPGELPRQPRATVVADGTGDPMLFCLPSFTWFYSPDYYAPFAAGLGGERPLAMLDLPGFAEDEPLPADAAALASVLSDAVRRTADGRGVVLVGHSAGGFIAGVVAAELERRGHGPQGLVLLDTPVWDTSSLPAWSPVFGRWLAEATAPMRGSLDGEAWITARAHYAGLDYTADVAAPSLLVRATRLLTGLQPESDGWSVDWPGPHDTRTVNGDHFSMIKDHADECARAVEGWIRELPTNTR